MMGRSLLWVLVVIGFVLVAYGQKECPTGASQFTVDLTNNRAAQWDHFWEAAVGSGHALLTLRADYQRHLQAAHIDLGVQTVRFHGIFDDDMSVFLGPDSSKASSYSFANVDSSYDYIVSLGMKPIVELSFMPNALANGTSCIMHYCGNINPPKRWSDWYNLVFYFTQHLVDRYGIEEVSTWFFEVWNEPNIDFWSGSQAQYFQLYGEAAAAVKAVSPRVQIGGPITAASKWIPDFIYWCQSNRIPLDFIDTHIYPTDISPTTRGIMISVIERTLSDAQGLPVIYSEYNSGLYYPGFHDDPFAAAFVFYNLQLANQRNLTQKGLKALSYWCVSDIFEEGGFISVPFHEGFGIQTINQVPKPVYRAFELLHKTGNVRHNVTGSHPTAGVVAVSNGNSSKDWMFLVYNHDTPPVVVRNASICVNLPGLKSSAINSVYMERVDDTHANGKTAWLNMGSPTYPTKDQILTMLTASQLVRESVTLYSAAGGLGFSLEVPPQGIAAITISLN